MNAKRWLDVALVIAAAPLYGTVILASMAAVRIVDGAPVFFTQTRVGRDRIPFDVLKLRTMTLEADPVQRRPTRLGAMLRHRGLDELPQFLNVLRGDMSLVGPRPLSESDTQRLLAVEPRFERRFAVQPGITGLAQVDGVRGARATADADAHYAEHRSLALDLHILARTVLINLVGKRRA